MRASRALPSEALTVPRLPHLPQLDGLRAIAVLTVFIGHTHVLPSWPGGFGVTIFFFLSGFLITTLLRIERAQTGCVSLKGFYLRRVLRINPPLWLTMAALFAAAAAGLMGSVAVTPRGIVAQALFFSNYAWRNEGLPLVLWSLAVEEHFYLVFPLVFSLAMRRISASGLAFACFVACLGVMAVRLVNIIGFGIVDDNYYWSHTRIDSILAGCILALWQNPVAGPGQVWRPGRSAVAIAMAILAASFVIRDPVFREGMRYSLQAVALFILFSAILQRRGGVASVLESWPMQRLGLYSYTFYLVHYGMIFIVRHGLAEVAPWAQGAIAGVLALVYSWGMHLLVEKPLGRMRQRLNKVEEPDPKLSAGLVAGASIRTRAGSMSGSRPG